MRAGNLTIRCALGRSGVTGRKREGDGATPRGRWPFLGVLTRRDRIRFLATRLAQRSIRADDGWCDDAADRNYNRPVRLPYPAGHEALWRGDRLYDVVVVLGYNIAPRARGRGSAIFFHLAHADFRPTQGCVAISPDDMRKLLPLCSRRTRMIVD